MTLERRRRPADDDDESDVPGKSELVKETGDAARRDASDRAAELLARLRKL